MVSLVSYRTLSGSGGASQSKPDTSYDSISIPQRALLVKGIDLMFR